MIVDVSPLANLHAVVITSCSSNPADRHSVPRVEEKRSPWPLGSRLSALLDDYLPWPGESR